MEWIIVFIGIIFLLWLGSYLHNKIKKERELKQQQERQRLELERRRQQYLKEEAEKAEREKALNQQQEQQRLELERRRQQYLKEQAERDERQRALKQQQEQQRIELERKRQEYLKKQLEEQKRIALEAYVDIETTGFSSSDEITVIGIYLYRDADTKLVQLVDEDADITQANLLKALSGVDIIYTFSGSSFDLPRIRNRLGIDLATYFRHHDLVRDCHARGLYGGLKEVEERLGIQRRLRDMDGQKAARLWWQYKNYHDQNALDKLLEYNKEDVMNLKVLRDKLMEMKNESAH